MSVLPFKISRKRVKYTCFILRKRDESAIIILRKRVKSG